MSLKDRYEHVQNRNGKPIDILVGTIVSKCEELITSGTRLPFYINDFDIGYVNRIEFVARLLTKHGIRVSFFPQGVVVIGLEEPIL